MTESRMGAHTIWNSSFRPLFFYRLALRGQPIGEGAMVGCAEIGVIYSMLPTSLRVRMSGERRAPSSAVSCLYGLLPSVGCMRMAIEWGPQGGYPHERGERSTLIISPLRTVSRSC